MLHQFRTKDTSLAVEVVGEGNIAILFVHGLGSNHKCWYRARDYFDLRRYRLILPDLPGFGQSVASSDYDYSMTALGASLRALIEDCAFPDWHVVAHSMGGAIALQLFTDCGRIPRSFASAEGNLVAADAFMSRKIACRSEVAFVKAYPKWVQVLRQSFGRQPNEQHERYVQSLLETAPVAVYRAACACLEASCSGELARRFAALSRPTAYVYGEQSRRDRGLPAVALLSQVQRLEVPGQGHFMMENADCFYPWLNSWVEASSSQRS